MAASTRPVEELAAKTDALQLGHEHADEGVQVAGPLLLVVPVELAAEHLRRHLEQLACGSTAQPLAGKKEGSGLMAKLTEKNRKNPTRVSETSRVRPARSSSCATSENMRTCDCEFTISRVAQLTL